MDHPDFVISLHLPLHPSSNTHVMLCHVLSHVKKHVKKCMCHLRTCWFDWAFPMKLSSLESFIISLLVLGTFAVAQLSEEELRHLVAVRRL